MVHNVVQPDLIDSLATTDGYSYLLDMFSSPLFQLQEEEEEEEEEEEQEGEEEQIQQQEMSTEDGKSSKECLNESSGQTARSVHKETLNRMEVHSEYLNDNVDTNGSGPVQDPDHPMDTLAMEPTPPKRPRQKGLTWTQTEHELFLEGVEKYGRGDWKSIAKTFVFTRTPAQVASHAQKYFDRLKRCKKPGAGRRCKSMALKDSHAFPKPIIHSTICVPPNYSVVHPTFYVPPSDDDHVPLTFSNPPMDFEKIPLSFTNPRLEESRKIGSTFSFPSADSATFTRTDPFPQLKFLKVLPTIYAPPSNYSRVRVFPTIYVPPSDNDLFSEDVYQPSTDFITNPTSDNDIIHPTTYIPPSENIYSDADLHIPSPNPITTPPSIEINVQPIISVHPSKDTLTNPDAYFPSLDFLNDSCLGSISAPLTNPVSPLNSSFANPDENPTLDFLDAPPLNDNSGVHQTTQLPQSDINTFKPTSPIAPNDFSYIQPAVSNILSPEYAFPPSTTTCQTIPTSPYDVTYMEQMFVEQFFLHQNRGFMEFMGM